MPTKVAFYYDTYKKKTKKITPDAAERTVLCKTTHRATLMFGSSNIFYESTHPAYHYFV